MRLLTVGDVTRPFLTPPREITMNMDEAIFKIITSKVAQLIFVKSLKRSKSNN